MTISSVGEGDPREMSGRERAIHGCIVSFVNQHGKTFVWHSPGPLREALSEACDIATAIDSTFRVVSVATPASIYTDLIGLRDERPEPTLMAAVNRSHLMHHSLRGRFSKKYRAMDDA